MSEQNNLKFNVLSPVTVVKLPIDTAIEHFAIMPVSRSITLSVNLPTMINARYFKELVFVDGNLPDSPKLSKMYILCLNGLWNLCYRAMIYYRSHTIT